MTLSKKSLLKAALLAAMAAPTLMPLAYGQQEVDPTWYDPWASNAKPAAHAMAPKAQAAEHKDKAPKKVAASQVTHKKPVKAQEPTQTAQVDGAPRTN